MIPFGADPRWHKAKVYESGEINPATGEPYQLLIYPETNFAPENIHVHDYLSGGQISFNMWLSAFYTDQFGNARHNMFYRFCVWHDAEGAPYEAPEGTRIDHAANPVNIRQTTGAADADVPKYLPIWQFLYSADKIEARYGDLV